MTLLTVSKRLWKKRRVRNKYWSLPLQLPFSVTETNASIVDLPLDCADDNPVRWLSGTGSYLSSCSLFHLLMVAGPCSSASRINLEISSVGQTTMGVALALYLVLSVWTNFDKPEWCFELFADRKWSTHGKKEELEWKGWCKRFERIVLLSYACIPSSKDACILWRSPCRGRLATRAYEYKFYQSPMLVCENHYIHYVFCSFGYRVSTRAMY